MTSASDPDTFMSPRCFDLVFVSSLFSHLPRNRFEPWLAKLWSTVSDRGLMIFTTRGMDHGGDGDAVDGFEFRAGSESRSLDASEYGQTFVSESFVSQAIRSVVGRGAVWWCIPRGYVGFQDIYIVSRDPKRDLASLRHDAGLVGHTDGARRSSEAVAVGGWAVDLGSNSVPRVRVYLDARCVAECVPTVDRPDLARHFGSERFARGGFVCQLEGDSIGLDDWLTMKVARDVGSEQTISVSKLEAMLRW